MNKTISIYGIDMYYGVKVVQKCEPNEAHDMIKAIFDIYSNIVMVNVRNQNGEINVIPRHTMTDEWLKSERTI